jgi:hypothetical protein
MPEHGDYHTGLHKWYCNYWQSSKKFMIMRHRIHQRNPQMIRLMELQGKSLKNKQMSLGQKS